MKWFLQDNRFNWIRQILLVLFLNPKAKPFKIAINKKDSWKVYRKSYSLSDDGENVKKKLFTIWNDSRFYTEEETHEEEMNLKSQHYVSARDARREFYEAEGQESTPSFLEESKIGKFTRTPMPSSPPVPPKKSNKYKIH